jgi:hypothetical protein
MWSEVSWLRIEKNVRRDFRNKGWCRHVKGKGSKYATIKDL